MKIPHRPTRVQYISANDTITSFAGLKPLTDLAHRLGITRDMSMVTVKKRQRGIPTVDFLMSLVLNFIVGGEHLSDLAQLRDERATRSLLGGLDVPAPTTAGEFLRKFSLGHIRQIENVIARAIRRADDRIGDSKPITLDGDSSIFEVHGYLKDGARYGYSRVNGFHPLFAFWSEKRLLVRAALRAGNRTSAHGAVAFLKTCVKRLPKDRTINLRLDAGFYAHDIVSFAEEHGLGFSISAKQTSALRAQIDAVPEEKWSAYPWEQDAKWTEFTYQPYRWSRSFRLLVKRTPLYQGAQQVLGRYFYAAVITNRRGAGSSLIRFHLARGGAENFIEEFKNGIGARLLPSQRFLANWAWLVIAQLAYNLVQWFKLLVLPACDHGRQIKSLRLHWFHVAARVIRSGRRCKLALARGPTAAHRFQAAQAIIAAL